MSDRASTSVKVGSVSLTVSPHAKGWRFGFKGESGVWEYITRKHKRDAIDAARAKAKELHNGAADALLTPDELALWNRVKKLRITHADLDRWEQTLSRPIITLDKAVEEILKLKEANKGRSSRNIKGLRGDLTSLAKFFPGRDFASIRSAELVEWLATFDKAGPRRKKNLRGHLVTFFRWGRRAGYLADGTTEAEKLEAPIVPMGIPETWTIEETAKLLRHCPERDIEWLVCSLFQGFRSEAELVVDPTSKKSPLDWSDFKWDRDIIIVRPETSKTKRRRVAPIHPVTRAWLYHRRRESGPVCLQDKRPWQSKDNKVTVPALTTVLGAHVGGWRRNASRHSFISYRAAQVGLAQTAMESGNTEGEARKSYNDAKSRAEADLYFSLTPDKLDEVIAGNRSD
jgi:integrase